MLNNFKHIIEILMDRTEIIPSCAILSDDKKAGRFVLMKLLS